MQGFLALSSVSPGLELDTENPIWRFYGFSQLLICNAHINTITNKQKIWQNIFCHPNNCYIGKMI